MAATTHKEGSSHFTDNYKLFGELGRGSFSIVRKCVERSTGLEFAAKIIGTLEMTMSDLEDLKTEIRICRKLIHPNIVQLHDTIEGVYHQYLIFELISGGELLEDIVARVNYSEADASHYIQQVLEAIKHCHQNKIIHRDLKPDNILLASRTPGAAVKLIDFGLAVEIFKNEEEHFGLAGTLIYMSPEILEMEPYGKAVDMWSCGVILYILLVGSPPFWHSDRNKKIELIKSGRYPTKSQEWLTLTPAAQNLIVQMLNVNSRKRITATQALEHPWIQRRDVMASELNRRETLNSLKKFNGLRKLKGAVLTIKTVQALARRNIHNRNLSTDQTVASGEISYIEDVNELDQAQFAEAQLAPAQLEPEPGIVSRSVFQRIRDFCVVV